MGATPLVGLAGTEISVRAYREVEQELGVEKLEEIESTPLSEVSGDIQTMFVQAFLRAEGGLYFAGDAFLGAKIEGAWRSGQEAARAILAEG